MSKGAMRVKNVICLILLGIIFSLAAPDSAVARDYEWDGTVLGRRQSYTVRPDDSLLEIGRWYDLGSTEMTAANPGVDPFVPDTGRRIVIPTEWILPDVPVREGIVINLAEMRLYFYPGKGSRIFTTFPAGIGDEGKDTPVGRFTIVEKIRDPSWHVPESIRKERPDLPAVVPPGPDNPMGSYALRLSNPSILIHGTNRPWGIGTRGSHGCIRMFEEDIVQLFYMVQRGTPVTIVNQPVKVAVFGSGVYLEVHSYGDGRNLYREALAVLTAKGLAGRADLKKVRKATRARRGLPTDISK